MPECENHGHAQQMTLSPVRKTFTLVHSHNETQANVI